jgi:hypothetical protein
MMSRIYSWYWKISTGRHFQNGHHNTANIQHCTISSKFDMWVDNDVPNWFLTSKNFYRSPISKWLPQYRTNSTLSDFNDISYVAGVSKWAGTRYFYPSKIVYSIGRNYWTPPPKLAVVKTTSTIGLWNIFHKKLMITSIAEFSHSKRKTVFSHDQVDRIFPVLKITLP